MGLLEQQQKEACDVNGKKAAIGWTKENHYTLVTILRERLATAVSAALSLTWTYLIPINVALPWLRGYRKNKS